MDTSQQRTNTAESTAVASATVTSIDTAGRLGEGNARDSNHAPKTADELIDMFVAGIEVYSREQLLDAIESGVFHLYKLHASAWTLVEFIDTAYGKTMNIMTTVGNLHEWKTGWDAIEQIARKNDCNCIFSIGHPAWKRFVESVGFTTTPMLKMVKFIEYEEDL